MNSITLTLNSYSLRIIKKSLDTYVPEDNLEKEETTKLKEWIDYLLKEES